MQSSEVMCSFVRTFVRAFRRLSRNARLYSTKKRLNIEALIFARICRLTRYIHLAIFMQILNFLDFQFVGQRFELNTWASAYVKSIGFVGTAETMRTDYSIVMMSRGVRICQGVFFKKNAYGIRRSVSVCVCVCVGVCVCMCV